MVLRQSIQKLLQDIDPVVQPQNEDKTIKEKSKKTQIIKLKSKKTQIIKQKRPMNHRSLSIIIMILIPHLGVGILLLEETDGDIPHFMDQDLGLDQDSDLDQGLDQDLGSGLDQDLVMRGMILSFMIPFILLLAVSMVHGEVIGEITMDMEGIIGHLTTMEATIIITTQKGLIDVLW